MKDTTLYDELLGLKHPWYVAGVRLDVVKQEVEVEVRSNDTTWACPHDIDRYTDEHIPNKAWLDIPCEF